MDQYKNMKARSLLLTASRKLEWTGEDLPEPSHHQVLVKTECTAVSLGTELPTYLGSSRHFNHTYPSMTGYESLGRVIAFGADVTTLERGNRVVAFYGHRSHALVDANRAIKIPQDTSDKIALLSILSCDVAKGIRKLGAKPEETVLVSGTGAIGLLAVFILRAYGLQTVDVIEPKQERRELALTLGARNAYPAEISLMDSYAYALECSGHNLAFQKVQTLMKQDGAICVLADGHLEPFTLLPEFHCKELQIVGSSDGWDYQKHATWFFALEQEKLQKLEKLFDLTIMADELPKTFDAIAEEQISSVKILVRFE
jgi:alcohol dehydrogenase